MASRPARDYNSLSLKHQSLCEKQMFQSMAFIIYLGEFHPFICSFLQYLRVALPRGLLILALRLLFFGDLLGLTFPLSPGTSAFCCLLSCSIASSAESTITNLPPSSPVSAEVSFVSSTELTILSCFQFAPFLSCFC